MLSQSKAGISWPVQEHTSDPVALFFQPGSKLSWHWNWNKNYKSLLPGTSPGLEIHAEFVPMIFGADYLDNGVALHDGWTVLFGYNEPDSCDPSVAVNLSPESAAAAWVNLAKLRDSPHKKLASPAVASNHDWLKAFLALLPDEAKPDYLTVHVYTTTFDDFVRRVEGFYHEFGLPLIVNEFAMHSFDPNVPPPSSQQQVHDFMGQTTNWLDATPYIVKYSWFGAVRNADNLHGVGGLNRLMDELGQITPLGGQYIAGGHD